ncbi:MAG: hypothetical protein ABSD98_16915 [Candidatus Korobacteraceae bacterium]|jgi:hypothetical protein
MGVIVCCAAVPQETAPPGTTLAHTRTEFHFVVDAPFEQTAPLFGANEERKWAPDWNPQFIYPIPAHDQPGMVFRVEHGDHSSVWANTAFDLAAGHIQYAYVLNDAMATLIDIHLTRDSAQKTGVTVVYERTALIPEANEHVQHFAKGDAKAGKEWEAAINGYFAKQRGHATPK